MPATEAVSFEVEAVLEIMAARLEGTIGAKGALAGECSVRKLFAEIRRAVLEVAAQDIEDCQAPLHETSPKGVCADVGYGSQDEVSVRAGRC